MKFSKEMLKLYLVTDRKWLDDRKLEDDIEKAIIGGVTMVQLKEKNLSNDEFIKIANKVKRVCQKHQIPFIINDNLEVALSVDSDGIHIGQNDLPASLVRKLIGSDKILGVSVHNLDEARSAETDGANYLGVGAMFATNTKDDADNISFNKLNDICKNVKIPVVAIGGINCDNICQFKNINIAGVAVVSAIMKANDITAATKKLITELEKND